MRTRRPTRLKTFDYRGRHRYFVTCSTEGRRKLFVDPVVVGVETNEILQTCAERQFNILAYVFMEDHLHLLLEGACDDSDFKSTMTLLRQRTAIAYKRQCGDRLWQDGYFERVLRPTDDVFEIIRYIRANPSTAGLSAERAAYPYVSWAADCDARSAPL